MAGKGMGSATKGGGCVESGPKNKYVSKPSKTTGSVVMAAKGGLMVSPRKKMAMGMKKGGMC